MIQIYKTSEKKKEIKKLLTIFLEVIERECYYTSAKMVWFYQKKYPEEFNNLNRKKTQKFIMRQYAGYMTMFSRLELHERVTGAKSRRTYKRLDITIEKVKQFIDEGKLLKSCDKKKFFQKPNMNSERFLWDAENGFKSEVSGIFIDQSLPFLDFSKKSEFDFSEGYRKADICCTSTCKACLNSCIEPINIILQKACGVVKSE